MPYRLNAKFTDWRPQSAEDNQAVRTLHMAVYDESGQLVTNRMEPPLSAYEDFNQERHPDKETTKHRNKPQREPPIPGAAAKKDAKPSGSYIEYSPTSGHTRRQKVARCPIAACGDQAVPTSHFLAHMLQHRFETSPTVVYGNSPALSLRLDLQDIQQAKDNVCLKILLYGGRTCSEDPCFICATANQCLPSSYSRYKTHLPLALMASCSNWSNFYAVPESQRTSDDTLLCLWMLSGDSLRPLQCTLTVYGLRDTGKSVSQLMPLQNIYDGSIEFLNSSGGGVSNVLYLNSGNIKSLLGDSEHKTAPVVKLEVLVHDLPYLYTN